MDRSAERLGRGFLMLLHGKCELGWDEGSQKKRWGERKKRKERCFVVSMQRSVVTAAHTSLARVRVACPCFGFWIFWVHFSFTTTTSILPEGTLSITPVSLSSFGSLFLLQSNRCLGLRHLGGEWRDGDMRKRDKLWPVNVADAVGDNELEHIRHHCEPE